MNKLFGKWADHIFKHAKWYITIVGILTVVFGLGLSRIQMKMGNDVFVSPKSAIYKNTQTYQKNFGGDSAYLMLNGKQSDIISHATMQKVADFSQRANKVDNVARRQV